MEGLKSAALATSPLPFPEWDWNAAQPPRPSMATLTSSPCPPMSRAQPRPAWVIPAPALVTPLKVEMVPEPCRGVGCLAGVVGQSHAPVLLPVNTNTAGWAMLTCARLRKVSAHLPRSPPVQRSHLRVFGRLLCQASSHLSPGPRPGRTQQSNISKRSVLRSTGRALSVS